MNNEITKYINDERARGVRDEDIRIALIANKWSEADINEALVGNASVVTPVEATKKCELGFSIEYLKYLFQGRIGRFYYLEGGVITGLMLLLLLAPLFYIFIPIEIEAGMVKDYMARHIMLALPLYLLCVPFFIMYYSLMVRRLHDLNKSGWWVLLTFIPFISSLLSLYILFFRGTPGPNNFGPPEPYFQTTKAAWNALFRR